MTSNPLQSHEHQHTRPGHGPAPENDSDLAELLDLDALHAIAFLNKAIDVAASALGREPAEVVDLGAGTGTGTVALATRFSRARVHALDASAGMLDRVRASSADVGASHRLETHLVDLDHDWPAVLPGPVDLVWAALSLHHTTAPAQVLKQAFHLLRPGGVAVVTEFSGTTNYSPPDLRTTSQGLGGRLVEALASRGYPVTADWTEALEAAGFDPVEKHVVTVSVSSVTAEGSRFLELQLSRTRQLIADDLDRGELAQLDAAIASVMLGGSTGAHLEFVSGRVFWVAVRPDSPEAELVTGGAGR